MTPSLKTVPCPEEALAAGDGVIDVIRLVSQLTFDWKVVPAGPRRWAPTDVSVEVDDGRIMIARATYRSLGDRAVTLAGADDEVETNWLAGRLATPLLFADYRRSHPEASPAAALAVVAAKPVWGELVIPQGDGSSPWRIGRVEGSSRPVHLAALRNGNGQQMLASYGIAADELMALIPTLLDPAEDGDVIRDMHVRHRRALAQRWWDAPRTPWPQPSTGSPPPG